MKTLLEVCNNLGESNITENVDVHVWNITVILTLLCSLNRLSIFVKSIVVFLESYAIKLEKIGFTV